MGETTFWWFRRDPGIPIEGTPWDTIRRAAGPGDAGSKDREEMVKRYRGDVYKIARRISGSRECAEDISQEFVLLFLKAEIYTTLDQQKGSFRGFLYEWVHNRLVDLWRKEKQGREVSNEGVDAEWKGTSPEEMVDICIRLKRLDTALRRTKEGLRADAWEAFRRVDLPRDGEPRITQAELARSMGWSLSKVEQVLKVARDFFMNAWASLLTVEEGNAEIVDAETKAMKVALETGLLRYWQRPTDL